jgi:hypothetical protein
MILPHAEAQRRRVAESKSLKSLRYRERYRFFKPRRTASASPADFLNCPIW